MPASPQPFVSPAWLPGGHLQTIYPYFFVPLPAITYRRERLETPDGDFIDLDWMDGDANAPLVVLFHGLEGSSRGHYAVSLLAAIRKKGWRGVVPHFRGCGGEPNRLPRAYHSGDSDEIDWVLRHLKQTNTATPLYAAGVSLGGNALLKWLGEQQEKATPVIQAAVAVSAPVDLAAAGQVLDNGFNKFTYTRHFLRTLKQKTELKFHRHALSLDRAAIRAANTLYAFDDAYTAPIHGFLDADDYWHKASSKPWLKHIQVPTLLINALNDPFLPAAALPAADQVSTSVTLEYPAQGGHAGFVSGPFPGNLEWLPARILHFLTHTQ